MKNTTHDTGPSKPRRFAFVVNSDSPIASWSVLEKLKTRFPDHEVDLFHVSDMLKSSRTSLALAALETLMTYPMDIASGRKRLRNAIFRSASAARFVQHHMQSTIRPETHDFVFQMQSLWSAKVPGVPHFLYTDHTNLTHETYPLPDIGAIYNTSFLRRERAIYHGASAVFTRSENVTRDVIERYGTPPEQVTCVYAGANTEQDTARSAALPPRNPDDKIILFVGKDWERKGGPDLVKAFEKLSKHHEQARLILIGCNPQDLPDTNRIEVLGRLPNDQLAAHYARANVFCMPTLREPFGIVFIEAMSFGLPLIGADIGAIPDFILPGQNGYLVPPNDPAEIAEALRKLLDNPDQCRDFGTCSQKLAHERYNWSAVADKMATRIRREIAPPET